jgi:hypothetical protein
MEDERSRSARTSLAAAALVAAACGGLAACAPPGRAADEDAPARPGSAAQGLVDAYCLLNVHTDDDTVHFEGPKWRLASAEGAGPLVLELRVLRFVLPATSSATTIKLDPDKVSSVVGYSVTQRIGVDDFTLVTVTTGHFQRVEAYPSFRRTIFQIRDASCNVPLGMGAAYRPIGVMFKVLETKDVALPDVGVQVVEVLDDGSNTLVVGNPPSSSGNASGGGTSGAIPIGNGVFGAGNSRTGSAWVGYP